jgi:hypothetical protein
VIFIEVRCDKCGSVGLSRRCFYAHQMREELKAKGWKHIAEGGNGCWRKEDTDGPVYNRGRSEGWADVCAELRAILDPDDGHRWNKDGLLKEVERLARDHK